MKVSFPDDPRVLAGQWNVRVTGTEMPVRAFVHAPAAGRMVVWTWDDLTSFQLQPGGNWAPADSAGLADAEPESYDPLLEAFVAVSLGAPSPRIRVTPVDGAPAAEVEIAVPAGDPVQAVWVGSGRVFGLRPTPTGHELIWWDALSGEAGGPIAVTGVRDGVRVSSNGRVLALWDLDAYRVTVVDAGALQPTARALRLGVCRSNALTQASDDGRWFVFSDCQGNLRVADLSRPESSSQPLGISNPAQIGFAVASDELVWVGQDGVVKGLNVVTRARRNLAQLDPTERDGLDPWHADLVVDEQAGLLALITGRGTVRLQSLAGAPEPVELPPLPIALARMSLTPRQLDTASYSYRFEGTFEVVAGAGAGERLTVDGDVYAHGLHEYVPAAALRPAAFLPSLHGSAKLLEPDGRQQRYGLEFRTVDRNALAYAGVLYGVQGGFAHRVMVERPAADPWPATGHD